MFRPEAPKWYVREMSGMTHSLPFRISGNRIHMSQSHIWKCNIKWISCTKTRQIINVWICSLSGHLQACCYMSSGHWNLLYCLFSPQLSWISKHINTKKWQMRRTAKQLLKATSLPCVNDKGHYTYNAKDKWAGHATLMGQLEHSQVMTWKL